MEFICLVSYLSDGTIQWSTSIGSVPDDVMKQMVHTCRTSVSISSAFEKVIKDTAPPNDESPEQERSKTTNRNAVLVNSEESTVILAKPARNSPNSWFAILGRPVVLRDEEIGYEMLNTLEQLADTFFLSAVEDQDHLYWLCENISSLFKPSARWTVRTCATRFVESLKQLSDEQIKRRDKRRLRQSDFSGSVLTTMLNEAVGQYLEAFHTAIDEHYGASQVQLCVFDSNMNFLYVKNLHRYELDALGWYFSECLGARSGILRDNWFDWEKSGCFQIWCRDRPHVFFSNFICSKRYNGNPPKRVRKATNALLQAVLRANS